MSASPLTTAGLEGAAARLDSYERATRAALARGGPLLAPVAQLCDAQLSALFAPRLLDSLVIRPLGRGVECDASQMSHHS